MGGRRYNKRHNQGVFGPPESPTTTAITRMEASYSGPLPPPSMLAKYNEALPNGAERLMIMAERQSAHREALEAVVVHSNVQSQKRGSWFGFIIVMTAILGGIYLIKIGMHGEGLAAIITSLVALASVFIYGKKKEGDELKKKADALAKRMNQ